jgi:hypothetical protein
MSDPTIVLTATDNASRVLAGVRGQIDKLNLVAAKLGNVLGSIGVGLSAGALAGLVKGINDGVDALNDLKDASGSTIENISALEDAAARTGTSFDTVGTLLVKFNGILKDARPGSQAEAALKALNLSVRELQQLDPAEALRRTSVALAEFADDGNKARLSQELFGKSLREVAPLLTDLAKQGELVATVTTRQAEEAEKFNLELARLSKNAVDAQRALVGPLVGALNEVIEKFREGQKEGRSFFDISSERYRQNVRDFYKLLGVDVAPSGRNAGLAALTGSDRIQGQADRINAIAAARLQRQGSLGRPSVGGGSAKGGGGASAATAAVRGEANDMERYLESLQRTLQSTQNLSEVEKARIRIAENLGRTSSVVTNKKIIEIATEIDKQRELKTVIEQAVEEAAALDEGLIAGEKSEQAAAGRRLQDRQAQLKSLLSNTDDERFARIREDVALLAEEFTAGRLAGGVEQYIQAVQNAVGQTGEAVEKTKSAVDELNLSFASAFEDAIVGGKSFQDVLKGIGQDILRLSVSRAITEPLGGFLTSALGGLLSFDGGGYTGSGARAGGLDGKGGFLSLLHPRETVIDHTKGGTAGGTVNLYLTQNNGALVTPQELARNNEQLVRQIQGGLLRSQQYGGALA